MANLIRKSILSFLFFLTTGCSFLTASLTDDFGNNLKQAILDHDDPKMVAEAIPPYLLLQESLLIKDPDNKVLLTSTANLYTSYIVLAENLDDKRKQRLSQKAFTYSLRSACLYKQVYCALNKKKYDEFTQIIDQSNISDLDTLYALGKNWANWIKINRSDWNAVAQLAQVKYIMTHVISQKDDYKKGEAHLYMAILESIVPPALGGKPDVAKLHFEKALQLSNNKNLMTKVLYAKHYARMMFDRELHDSLLKTVISAKVTEKNLTLSNTLAQQQAKKLLQSAEDYF
jgi:signal transduction histidine kinase